MDKDVANQIVDDVERRNKEGLEIMDLENSEEEFNAIPILEGYEMPPSPKTQPPSLQKNPNC